MSLPPLPTLPMIPNKKATIEDGIKLCKLLRMILLPHGFYPALTGGLLYKNGERKDIDIVIYRNRQKIKEFEITDLTPLLDKIGLNIISTYGFCTKCKWKGFIVDVLNPETQSDLPEGEY